MTAAIRFFRGLNFLLLCIPVSLVLNSVPRMNPLWVFLTAALAIIPLAGLMGQATEELAKHLGATWGGLLNATFGNAAELIIGLSALHAGAHLVPLVQASIVGSILGNILLVLGASIMAGGLRYKLQTFNQDQAESQSINLLLAALSLSVPAIFVAAYSHRAAPSPVAIERLSLSVAGVLLVVYLASLWFSLRTHQDLFRACGAEDVDQDEPPLWNKRTAVGALALATVFVAVESEVLVKSVEGAAHALGLNNVFIGIIVLAIIGNNAEQSTAIWMAMKNKMDITMNIAIGSSIQIAMFVAPLLVFASVLMGHPMTFVFSIPEMTAIGFSVLIAAFIAGDGKCHWLEGAQLLAAYLLIALAFFFLPP